MVSKAAVVLHVLANDRPGGTQAVTLGHARALVATGVKQSVLFCSRRSDAPALREAFDAALVDVHYLPLEVGRLRFAVGLFNLCRRSHVTAVMTHGLGFHLVVAAVVRFAGVRRFIAMVGNPVTLDHTDLGVTRRRSKVAAPLVHAVIACSDYVAETLVEHVGLQPDVVRMLANPLDVIEVESRAASSRADRGEREIPVVCMVARLDPIKDHETVIRAVAHLCERSRPVNLLLVGSGSTEPNLRRLVDELGILDFVHFLGDRTEIPEILGSSDVFAFGMTRDEGFGVAVAEAMAARTPIVCTEAGPASEVLDGGRAGLLVPAGDATGMADGIERLLDEPETRATLVEAASTLAAQRHDVVRLREALVEVLGL
jgi:glycosyltransferase involved in cell wall biosynthesis